MAATNLANMIIPDQFARYVIEETAAKSELITSGIVENLSGEAAVLAQLGGKIIDMPFFKDLTGTSQLVSDSGNLTINNITTGADAAVKMYRAQVYGATDLSADLSGEDPIGAIVSRFAAWWAREFQRLLLQVLAGATATTEAGGSMATATTDISALAGNAAVFDGTSFIDAQGVLGDSSDKLSGIMIHSKTYQLMQKQDLIDFMKDSEGGKDIPTYMGKRVIVDDGCPVSTGVYTTYIFGTGAIGYAEAPVRVGAEADRDPLINGGQEYLVNRRSFIMHPRGVKWKGTAAGATPSDAELATASNWIRVYEQKNVRIARFIHRVAAA